MTSIDEFIPWGTPIAECPFCKELFSEYEAYFYCNDGYDFFEEVSDPRDGGIESYFSTRCPNCGESVDLTTIDRPYRYMVVKTVPPPRGTGFSLSRGRFSLSAGGFSLAAPGKFSLFSRRKRR